MANGVSGSLRLFSLFGINVYVHWSWFVVALIQYQIMRDANPLLHGAIYLSLFGIVLLHEFGHALACRSVGGIANHIVLWPLGGIAFVQPPPRPGALLWSIAAGPLVNVLLVPVTVVLLYAVDVGESAMADWTPIQFYVGTLAAINFLLLVFNMLPIYPLDGGQMLQAILWFFVGRVRSLRITATIGIAAAVVGGLVAAVMGDMWFLILALFLGWQAWNGLRYARALAAAEAWRM